MKRVVMLGLVALAIAGCGRDEPDPKDRAAPTGSAAAPSTLPSSAPSAAANATSAAASVPPTPAPGRLAESRAGAGRAPASTGGADTHTVVKGDTLAAIAQGRGMSAAELAAWNKVTDPRRLRIGQVLRLTPP